MKKITIRTFVSSDIPVLLELQTAYTADYPHAPVIPGEVYLAPAFEEGQNIFCAIDESGTLVGYAPIYPVLIRDDSILPHTLWVEIKTHPACHAPEVIKDQLFERLRLRSRELTEKFPGHPVHLTFQYFPSETSSIQYILSRGAQYTGSVFTMRRDLSRPIPSLSPLDEITICPWRMESETEQQLYVQARNECFPETPIALEEWQYFMQSPQWSVGTTFTAFHRDELVGNVAVFWNDMENRKSGKLIGFTEYIFVRAPWRGKNIARSLINAGLTHLKQHGLAEAHLEVRVENENAMRLYVDLGYEVIRESRFYVFKL